MAFQTGTQVRPELGRADVSGFARAGMITGQALAGLGQDIGEGIEKYKKNKQITTVALSELEGRISSDPSILTAMEEAAKDNPTIGKSLKNLNEGTYKQSDLLSLGGFASAYQNQKIAAQESQLREAKIKAAGTPKLSAFEEKRRALIQAGVSPQEATTRAASGQTIQVGPSGEPTIDPVLLRSQVALDTEVLNKEIIPAINAAPFIQKMEDILNKEGAEGIITGQLAKPELFLKSLGADLGMNFPDVASTKEYVANAGRQVGAIIRLFGAGTGLSDADREYAQQIAGGNIEVPIDALKRIVRAAKEASLGQIDRYNARVKRTYSEDTGLTPNQVSFTLGRLLIPEEERSLFQSPESLPESDANEEDEVEGLLRDLGIE